MNPLVSFMASSAGRAARVIAGIALLALAYFSLQGAVQIIVAVVALVPLLAGIFDFCVFAPLFGNPFMGKDIRGEA